MVTPPVHPGVETFLRTSLYLVLVGATSLIWLSNVPSTFSIIISVPFLLLSRLPPGSGVHRGSTLRHKASVDWAWIERTGCPWFLLVLVSISRYLVLVLLLEKYWVTQCSVTVTDSVSTVSVQYYLPARWRSQPRSPDRASCLIRVNPTTEIWGETERQHRAQRDRETTADRGIEMGSGACRPVLSYDGSDQHHQHHPALHSSQLQELKQFSLLTWKLF